MVGLDEAEVTAPELEVVDVTKLEEAVDAAAAEDEDVDEDVLSALVVAAVVPGAEDAVGLDDGASLEDESLEELSLDELSLAEELGEEVGSTAEEESDVDETGVAVGAEEAVG